MSWFCQAVHCLEGIARGIARHTPPAPAEFCAVPGDADEPRADHDPGTAAGTSPTDSPPPAPAPARGPLIWAAEPRGM
jgi:hypothetical protein